MQSTIFKAYKLLSVACLLVVAASTQRYHKVSQNSSLTELHSRILPSIDDIRLSVDSPTINQISSSPKKAKREREDVACTRNNRRAQFVATFKLNYSFRYAKSMRPAERR
jgi:hypothetical protein